MMTITIFRSREALLLSTFTHFILLDVEALFGRLSSLIGEEHTSELES
jgi:hypothetical protein